MPNPKAGLRAESRATNMSPRPEETWYWPPKDCEEVTYQFDLSSADEGSWLVVRQHLVGHLIVDFAVMQLHNPHGRSASDASTYEVARIDCSHGSCHWHYMDREGDWSRWGRPPIQGLYDSTTHHEVDNLYWVSYNLMLEHWESNLARWRKQ